MSTFIQGDNFERDGGNAEEIVWKKLKEALAGRDVLAYSRYPLFSRVGEKRKEPDVLILDRELGLIVIEVKAYRINDIEKIENNDWTMKNSYSRTVNPIAQAEDYLYTIRIKFEAERSLRSKVISTSYVALPNINKAQWMNSAFTNKLEGANIIFGDELSKVTLLNKLISTEPLIAGKVFNEEGLCLAEAILGHERNHVDEVNEKLPHGTKGRIYSQVKSKMFNLDIQQETIGKSIPPGMQRIRGIAGSGKTLLICQKAAYMHLSHSEWKIVVTFFTQSLYDTIIKTLDMYIKAFTNGELSYVADANSNLRVLHAWGGKTTTGLYREIALKNGVVPLTVNDVKNKLNKYVDPCSSINYISQGLLYETKGELVEAYDAILIDEGQDLIADEEFKYKDKQSFYYMAYKSLKPVSSDSIGLRRLIWAYDELQSLNDKKIPTSKELFGDASLVTGTYKGGLKKSEVMKKCYRTPYDVLTTAHAVGMGFYRKDGMLTGYTTKKEWEDIGYVVENGDFKREGNEIILTRPIENSPNPISEFYDGPCIKFNTFKSNQDVYKEVAKEVKNDIEVNGLKPSREILIINLDDDFGGDAISGILGAELNSIGLNYFIPSCSKPNIVKETNWRLKQPHKFWCDGAITISGITRAKGNEAAMVYVVGIESIARNEDDIAKRNKLFTALTRAKCWVKVLGVGDYSLYDELVKAIEAKGRFKFLYTKPKHESNDSEVTVTVGTTETEFNV